MLCAGVHARSWLCLEAGGSHQLSPSFSLSVNLELIHGLSGWLDKELQESACICPPMLGLDSATRPGPELGFSHLSSRQFNESCTHPDDFPVSWESFRGKIVIYVKIEKQVFLPSF